MITRILQGSTNNSNWTYRTIVREVETSISNQTSKVRIENYLGRASSSSYFAGNYTTSYEVNGELHRENKYMSTNVSARQYVLVGSYNFTIKHTKEPTIINVKSSLSSNDFTPSYSSASGDVVLTELHRQPEPTLTSITEKNPKLAGVSEFVTNLSIKDFYIDAKLYDNAKIAERIVDNKGNITTSTGFPTIVDYRSKSLIYEGNKAFFRLGVRDTLNSTGYINYEANVIPYEKPNLITTVSSVKRSGALTGKVKLNLKGTFYNKKIGQTTNQIKLSFGYSKTYVNTYFNIPNSVVSISGNTFTISNWNMAKNGVEISDIDKSSSYKFEIKVEDSFGNTDIIQLLCTKGEYLYCKFPDRVDFQKITQQNQNVALETKLDDDIVETNEYLFGKKVYTKTLSTYNPISPNLPLIMGIGINDYDRRWIDNSNSFIQNNEISYPLSAVNAYIDGEYLYMTSNQQWGTNWQKVVTIKFTKM